MSVRPWRLEPRFIASGSANLHTSLFTNASAQVARDAVLIVAPFAEEMNKCRPMMASAAQAFAGAGIDALLFDFFGTGDSAGDFSEATWPQWRRDVTTAWEILATRGAARIHVLAVRTGALFLPDLPRGSAVRGSALLWQPIVRGADFWRQFLRLSVAAAALRTGVQDSPQETLEREGQIEIAGYTIQRSLADELARAELKADALARFNAILWAEVTLNEPAVISPAGKRALSQWPELAPRIESCALRGEAFWSTPEIARVPSLIERSVAFVRGQS